MAASELPTGTLTFLMTDIEGSTRLWGAHPDLTAAVIERHDALGGSSVADRGGYLIRSKGEGDSTFSVFADPSEAVAAAVGAPLALRREQWPEGIDLRVRAALYTGEAELRNGNYYGTAPNRCARLRAVAHGRQTIRSESTESLLSGRYPRDVSLLDLGLHRLTDIVTRHRVPQAVSRGAYDIEGRQLANRGNVQTCGKREEVISQIPHLIRALNGLDPSCRDRFFTQSSTSQRPCHGPDRVGVPAQADRVGDRVTEGTRMTQVAVEGGRHRAMRLDPVPQLHKHTLLRSVGEQPLDPVQGLGVEARKRRATQPLK
jgi:class 3 adenylate cyclase